jgi:hypothetical protein
MEKMETLKQLLINGIRFRIDNCAKDEGKLLFSEIVKMDDKHMTLNRNQVNQLYIEVRTNKKYYDIYVDNVLSIMLNVDKFLTENISNLKKECSDYNFLVMDYIKPLKKVRIIMIKNAIIPKLDSSRDNNNNPNNTILLNKIAENNVVIQTESITESEPKNEPKKDSIKISNDIEEKKIMQLEEYKSKDITIQILPDITTEDTVILYDIEPIKKKRSKVE